MYRPLALTFKILKCLPHGIFLLLLFSLFVHIPAHPIQFIASSDRCSAIPDTCFITASMLFHFGIYRTFLWTLPNLIETETEIKEQCHLCAMPHKRYPWLILSFCILYVCNTSKYVIFVKL